MASPQDRLIHWLLGSLDLQTTLFHLGQYCGTWKASTTGLARAGFHLVLEGGCWLHLPGRQAPQALAAGDAVFFLRDLPHSLSSARDPDGAAAAPRQPMAPYAPGSPGAVALACGFFHFRAGLAANLLGSFPDYVVIRAGQPGLQELRPLFELILAEAERGGEAPSPLIARLVDLLFFYALRHLAGRREVDAGLCALLGQPEFAALLDALIQDPGRPWSVEAMADLSHMSRATFCKRFAERSGQSPGSFLVQLRMQRAAELLHQGESLSRIAEQVGYQSDAAFARAFKKTLGIQPGAYRRTRLTAALS